MAVEKQLNHRSGVLGLSGTSADIRDALESVEDNPQASRAHVTTQVYLWRLKKYLGAYLALVGDAEAVIFTDTIGETVPEVREAVCSGMDVFGISVDPVAIRRPILYLRMWPHLRAACGCGSWPPTKKSPLHGRHTKPYAHPDS